MVPSHDKKGATLAASVAALNQVEPMVVAAYIERLFGALAPASVKQHLAALRMLFDWLVVGQVLPFNPASSVRGPKHVVKTGKTPVLSAKETRALLGRPGSRRSLWMSAPKRDLTPSEMTTALIRLAFSARFSPAVRASAGLRVVCRGALVSPRLRAKIAPIALFDSS